MEAEFSERLKRYRKEKNMTQQELADALGVSPCWCPWPGPWG